MYSGFDRQRCFVVQHYYVLINLNQSWTGPLVVVVVVVLVIVLLLLLLLQLLLLLLQEVESILVFVYISEQLKNKVVCPITYFNVVWTIVFTFRLTSLV